MDCVAILGPTASGKSNLAMSIAGKLRGEIISVDSRQAYRGLDIGTSKPSREERRLVPHHLIDIIDPTERNSAEFYARAAHQVIDAVIGNGRLPVLVGGSGLYYRAVFEGLFDVELDPAERMRFEHSVKGISTDELASRLAADDPVTARRIHRNDRYRIIRALEVTELTGIPLSRHFELQAEKKRSGYDFLKIGIDLPRAVLHERIDARTKRMISGGWIDETKDLLDSGIDPDCPGLRTLGYPEIISFIRGEIDLEELIRDIQGLTRQYAKRQMTWFRKEKGVHWIGREGGDLEDEALSLIRNDS